MNRENLKLPEQANHCTLFAEVQRSPTNHDVQRRLTLY